MLQKRSTYLVQSHWNYNHGQNIWEKLWFLFEIAHYEKSLISIFKESYASIDKIFFLGGRLGTRL